MLFYCKLAYIDVM